MLFRLSTPMLKKISLSILPFLAVLVFSSEQLSEDGRAGYTGSPGEGDCTTCHTSFAVNTGGGSITFQNSGMPANEYVAGQTYNMSITVTRSTNILFGFGFEALNSANDNAGTLNITDAAATQIKTLLVSGITRRNVVHQLNAGAASGSKTFNFSWTAPATGSGAVSFYFAGVAADASGSNINDYVYKSSLTVTEQVCQPPVQPSVILGNTTVCPGDNQNYSVSPVAGATAYTWTLPSGWTGTSATNSISVIAGNASGTISVTANNACGSSSARTLALLSSDFVVSMSVTDVQCFGDTNGIATANVNGSSPPFTYQWSTNPIQYSSTASNLIAGNYSVTITDANSCSTISFATILGPSSALSSSAGNPQTTCEGTGVLIGGSPSASGGTIPYTYLWSPASGLNSSGNANPIANPVSSTTYTLEVTDANGCTSSDASLLTVLPAPIPFFAMSNDTFFASCCGLYQWYLDGNPITGATNSSYMPTIAGDYTLSVTYTNGCIRHSSVFSFNPVSVNNIYSTENIIVFPNPVLNNLNILLPEQCNQAEFKIIDILGNIVIEGTLMKGSNLIDAESLSTGLYTVSIKISNEKPIEKMRIIKY